MAILIKSSQVKMFPCQDRDDYWDRQSKMANEQNLISIVNRVVGRESFIVSGLGIENSGSTQQLMPGVCNIGGYLFNIHDYIKLDRAQSAGDRLYLSIKIQHSAIAESTPHPYVKLDRLLPYTRDNASLDTSTDADSSFLGVVITTSLEVDLESSDYIHLLIAEADSSRKWVSVNASIGVNSGVKNVSEFKFIASDILVDNKNSIARDIDNEIDYANKNQSLDWYLQTYYSIDDGDLDA